jgi:AraC-like DNA-binding protein
MPMEFKTYKPAKLNHLVVSIYERKTNFPVKMKMLPEGFVTLIFNISTEIKMVKGQKIDSRAFNPANVFCFLSGLHTSPLYFDLEELHVVGLIMYPAAVKAFFNMPTNEVKDHVIEGDFIGELNFIEDHLKSLHSFPERAYWLENYFFKKLNQAEDLHIAMKLNRTTQKMKKDVLQGKRLNIESYSGYSKMHTHRIFKDWLGLTPSKLIKMEQFNKAIELIHQSDLSLTQIGLESGFYDQAHFIRVFNEFAKMTPGQYKKGMTHLPGILFFE